MSEVRWQKLVRIALQMSDFQIIQTPKAPMVLYIRTNLEIKCCDINVYVIDVEF